MAAYMGQKSGRSEVLVGGIAKGPPEALRPPVLRLCGARGPDVHQDAERSAEQRHPGILHTPYVTK